jgi:O-methyltransferase
MAKKMKKNNFQKKFKAFFIRYKLHKIFGPFSNAMISLGYMSKLSQYLSQNKKKFKFNDFYTSTINFDSRTEMYDFVKKEEKLDDAVNFIEFGVFRGKSLKWWVESNNHKDSRFYGFDTFTGLPEDWGNYKKGTFSLEGKLPDIQDDRCEFIKGLFQDTTYETLKKVDFSKRSIFHVDVDLYTATVFVLAAIHPYLKENDIILFDEFGVPMHEFKAFQEFTNSFYVKLEPIAAKNNYLACAFKVVKV